MAARTSRPVVRARSAARAALAPQAPCTPPPGWADADARYSPATCVSGRPSPGVGRRNSCWCRALVPPFSAPPTRLRVRGVQVAGELHVPAEHQVAEPRREPVHLALDALDEAAALPGVPPVAGQLARRVAAGRRRHVRVRPGGLGAGRGAARVRRRHLAEQQEGLGGQPADGELVAEPGDRVQVAGEVHGAGAGHPVVAPRDRTGQRPVDLDRAVVPVEPGEVVPQPCRELVGVEQVPVQRRRGDVGQHRPPHPDGAPVGGPHADRPAVPDDDARHRRGALQPPAGGGQPGHQGPGQLAGASLAAPGSRPPGRASPAASRTGRWRAPRAPGRCAGRCRPAAAWRPRHGTAPRAKRRTGSTANRAKRSASAGPSRRASAAAERTGRERRHQRLDQQRVEVPPAVDELLPGAGVAAVERPDRRGRRREVPAQHGCAPVVERVREHGRRVPPRQAVLLQVQVAQHRRAERQGVEGAVQVVDEARSGRPPRSAPPRPAGPAPPGPAPPSRRRRAGWRRPGRSGRPR